MIAAARTMTHRDLRSFLLSLCVAAAALALASLSAGAQNPTSGVTLFGKVQDAETKAALPSLHTHDARSAPHQEGSTPGVSSISE